MLICMLSRQVSEHNMHTQAVIIFGVVVVTLWKELIMLGLNL